MHGRWSANGPPLRDRHIDVRSPEPAHGAAPDQTCAIGERDARADLEAKDVQVVCRSGVEGQDISHGEAGWYDNPG
jgi:hypothetical protein